MTAPVIPDGKPVMPPTIVEKTTPALDRPTTEPWVAEEQTRERSEEKDKAFESTVYNSAYTGKGSLLDELI